MQPFAKDEDDEGIKELDGDDENPGLPANVCRIKKVIMKVWTNISTKL